MTFVREELYRRALGMKNRELSVEFFASGGVCAPLSPIYQQYAFNIARIAEAYDLPPELVLGIPEELPSGS